MRGVTLSACFTTLALASISLSLSNAAAEAQALNLSQGGPITITSDGGIDWRQVQQEVIANQNARAVRGNVTVTADQLIAHYRKKAVTTGKTPAAPASATASPLDVGGDGSSGNEIYLLEARGGVHIFTPTDLAVGDHAAYDMDQAVLVLTGHDLKLTTPDHVITARDSLEYWTGQHMAVARGNAVVVTQDGRRIAADVLVAYTDPAPQPGAAPAPKKTAVASTPGAPGDPIADASGQLKLVNAIGHVVIQTATDIVQGDRGVYVPSLGIARIAGHVHITRGQNELTGAEALVNMKTGVSRLLSHTAGERVQGLIMPNQAPTPGAKPVPAGK
ncbi:LptA/OstA family protein [Acidisoma cladoniae]|jgi:lipopolysaccharide export system protein LptA|uniref:LptA/OstA family protein n=1 Tax=Acidisoma cladoniae TaxID=3040935 RepID=UPI002550E93A|nr:LptA/OstA family protein [Acidisoma sp. PAMC 29798]